MHIDTPLLLEQGSHSRGKKIKENAKYCVSNKASQNIKEAEINYLGRLQSISGIFAEPAAGLQ